MFVCGYSVKRAVYLPAWSEAKGPSRPAEKSSAGAHLEYDPNTGTHVLGGADGGSAVFCGIISGD